MGGDTLACPYCRERAGATVPGEGWYDLTCGSCGKKFRVLLATVRAKRSRGDRQTSSRDFSLRVKHNGVDEFIEFGTWGYDDIELRQGDTVALSYAGGKLIVVDNKTIGVARTVGLPWRDIFHGLLGLGVVGGLLWFFLLR